MQPDPKLASDIRQIFAEKFSNHPLIKEELVRQFIFHLFQKGYTASQVAIACNCRLTCFTAWHRSHGMLDGYTKMWCTHRRIADWLNRHLFEITVKPEPADIKTMFRCETHRF